MTVTIQLSAEQAAALEAQASNEGLTVDVWLLRLAEAYARSRDLSLERGSDQRPIWDVILDNMKDVPAEELGHLPTDGASEHDHYLYGHPKRNQ